jgi:hypothetical protein
MKLSTRASGQWVESGGDRSVFGLNTAELMELVDKLREENMLDCFRLLHYHIGSQIPNIRDIRAGALEAARVYAGLVEEGAAMGYLDLGGGLAVDYDGSHTNYMHSRNYTLAEYCVDVVETIGETLMANDIEQPVKETFCDEDGDPMVIDGYAVTTKEYDDYGNVARQAYFDAYDNPVSLSNGAHSVYKEYNLNKKVIYTAYYGTGGNAVTIKTGCSIVKNEYDDQGNMVLESYYDANENPVSLKAGNAAVRKTYNDRKKVTRTDYLAYMPKLQYLLMCSAPITDISYCANMKDLKYLELFLTKVTDFSPLLECKNLVDLNICYTSPEDPLIFGQMTQLKNLWFRNMYDWQVREQLRKALPNTTMVFDAGSSTGGGWRKLDNYYAQRKILGMPIMEED